MKASINIKTLAESLKKHLAATGDNSAKFAPMSYDLFVAPAMAIVEELAALEGDAVGYAIAKRIARPNADWRFNLSDKQAYCLAREIAEAIESGKIDAENFKTLLHIEEEKKVAKKAEKTAKNWKKAKEDKKAKEEAEVKAVEEICAVGNVISHSILGEGTVIANDGGNVTIEFGGVAKKFGISFLVGRISAAVVQ